MEGLGRIDGVLTGHGVHDEHDLVGTGRVLDAGEFVHESVVDVQAPGGVEDQRVDAGLLRFGERPLAHIDGDADGLAVRRDLVGLGVEEHAGAAGGLFADMIGHEAELLHSGGALEVGGGEHDGAPALLEVRGELAARGRFAGALQAAEHDDGGAGAGAGDAGGVVAGVRHERDEAVVDDADHFFAGLEALGDLAADGFGADFLAEVVDHVVVDVGLEQRGADVLHRVGDVGLGDGRLAGQTAEGAVETFG